MSNDFGVQPFKPLGWRLRSIRQKLNESLSDVSGAVEVEEALLSRYEQGKDRPTEDILMLLISHFNIQDDDALVLWELAGYENPERSEEAGPIESMLAKQPVLMLMAMDSRIVYTDGINVTASMDGVVLSFTQSGSQTAAGQPLTVARVGMSPTQASNILQALNQSLARLHGSVTPKALAAPKSRQPKKPNSN